MAKELPYFKFEPSAWENGNIQLCSFEAQGVFMNVCSMYWQRLGDLPYKLAVQKICKGNATVLDSLFEDGVIKMIEGMICIDFLNEQLSEFENISSKNRDNARLRWEKQRNNATAQQSHSERNAIREEEIRGEKKKEEESIIGADKSATIEQRAELFMEKVSLYLSDYPKEMLRRFYDYWTEKNEGGRKMRFEMQKVFDVKRRLTTWSNNEKSKINGNSKDKRQEHLTGLAADFAKRASERNGSGQL